MRTGVRLGARTAVGIILAVTAMAVLGACGGIIGSLVSTRNALSAAGYSKVSIGIGGNDNDLRVAATVAQDSSPGEIREIAAIVWRDFHQRFGSLEITLHAADRTIGQVIPFAELQREIGTRNPAYNTTSIRDGIIRTAIVVLVVALVVLVVVVVVVVLLLRRRRRRRVRPAAPWTQPGGPPPGARPAPDHSPTEEPGAWGAPAPAPVVSPAPQDPWQPPPGSGPSAWE